MEALLPFIRQDRLGLVQLVGNGVSELLRLHVCTQCNEPEGRPKSSVTKGRGKSRASSEAPNETSGEMSSVELPDFPPRFLAPQSPYLVPRYVKSFFQRFAVRS